MEYCLYNNYNNLINAKCIAHAKNLLNGLAIVSEAAVANVKITKSLATINPFIH